MSFLRGVPEAWQKRHVPDLRLVWERSVRIARLLNHLCKLFDKNTWIKEDFVIVFRHNFFVKRLSNFRYFRVDIMVKLSKRLVSLFQMFFFFWIMEQFQRFSVDMTSIFPKSLMLSEIRTRSGDFVFVVGNGYTTAHSIYKTSIYNIRTHTYAQKHRHIIDSCDVQLYISDI